MTLAEYKKLIMDRSEIVRKLLPIQQKSRDLAKRFIPPGANLIAADLCLDHVAATYNVDGILDTRIIPIEHLFEGE